jgi:hypothetical protein
MKLNRPAQAVLGALLAASGFIAASAAELEDAGTTAGIAPTATYNQITIGNFAGHWQMTVIGQTSCGFGTTVYTVTLNASGSGTAAGTYHSVCGDSATGTVAFKILSVNSHGSGTANLSCGTDCGWSLKVQLSPDHTVFNLVDVDPQNPQNFIEGTAVKQSY